VHNGYHQQYTELANIVWNRVRCWIRLQSVLVGFVKDEMTEIFARGRVTRPSLKG